MEPRNLGEALRRIGEGAAMIRSKGEAGTGNIVEAVRHMREITSGIRRLSTLGPEELATAAKDLQAPLEVVRDVATQGWLPVPLFCAGGIATPADAALMMQLGAEGNFVGSGIFKSEDPERRAKAIVEATTHFNDPERIAAASEQLGEAMPGIEIAALGEDGTAAGPRLVELERLDEPRVRIGVLAVQGEFAAHAAMLARARRRGGRGPDPEQLEGLDGLIIPGGESTDDHDGDRGGRARRRRSASITTRAGRCSAPAPG